MHRKDKNQSMKLIPSPIEVKEYEGFLPEKDIFQRKRFGEELSNLIQNVSDELVVALDAQWGEGKTTFVKMWQGILKNEEIDSIYFDAFKNDFLEDPFLALVGEVYLLLNEEKDTDVRKEFKKKAVLAVKAIGRVAIRTALRALTANLVDGTSLDGAGMEKEVADVSDKYISSRLDALEGDKAAIEEFRIALTEVVKSIAKKNKLVFIVDELDRCKPSFALELLEKIKHVFSVPGIVFVLVMNKQQLEEVIRLRYGSGIDSTKYLQKFVHIWLGFPKLTSVRVSDRQKYLENCLDRMDFDLNLRENTIWLKMYKELIEYYNDISLREIERSLINFAIIYNLTNGKLEIEYLWLSVFFSIIKVIYPSAYQDLSSGNISYEKLIDDTQLRSFKNDYLNKYNREHMLLLLLEYYLVDDVEEAEKVAIKAGFQSTMWMINRTAISDVCRWLG